MIDLSPGAVKNNPYHTYAIMLDKFPVCKIGPGDFWALTRYSDVKSALKDHHTFSSKAMDSLLKPDWLSEDCHRDLYLLTKDPPIHTHRRTIINKTFTNHVVKTLTPLMREAAEVLTRKLENSEEIDFIDNFSFPYAGKIINSIIGVEDEQDSEVVKNWVRIIGKLPVDKPNDETISLFEEEIRKQVKALENIVKNRRKKPQDDYVTALINTKSPEFDLTDDMRVNILDLFIRGGYVTTNHTLANTILQLARNSDIFLLLKASPQNIPNYIEEIMRLYPPTLAILRETTKSVELHGINIPKGSKVLLYIAAANRDPTVFPNPNDINLNRTNIKDHLAFGGGPHVCLGMALARLEIKIALESIIKNFSSIECHVDDSDLDWNYSVIVRGLNKLPIRFNLEGTE